jgi:tetratricopeptide (TPR) repeat protein
MDMKQIVVLIAILLGCIAALGFAWYYSQSAASGSAAITTQKRFTAKPGAMRDNALALTTDKRTEAAAAINESGGTEDAEKTIRVRSLSRPDENRLSEAETEIREALNALSPEQGMEKLEAMLAEGRADGREADIYCALGGLRARKNPPDYNAAAEAFLQARQAASGRAARQRVAIHEAQMHFYRGATASARKVVDSALAEPGPLNFESIQLGLMQGQIEESAGNLEEAEKAYNRMLDLALDAAGGDGETGGDLTDLIRLAGLRLSRIYRDSDRDDAALEIAKRVQDVIGG